MGRRGWTVCCVVVGLVVAGSALSAIAAESTVVLFVRHAEKAGDDPRDPRLSEAGRARAEALARLLAHAGVTHIFATQFRRTRQTVEPLAELTGRKVEVIPAQRPQAQLEALRALPAGSVALVAGHSNTIPDLICELGGRAADLDCSDAGRQLDEGEYDRLYLLILPPPDAPHRTPLQTLSLRYPARH